MPWRYAVSPTSAQVLPYTESRLPSSRTTSTERRVVRASLARRAASRAACGLRTATRGRSRVRAKSATSWSATSLPSSIVTTRSAVRAASFGSSVVNSTVPPPAAYARRTPCSQRLSRIERPSAGASRTSVCGSANSAQARPRRRSIPRESVSRRSSRRLTRSTTSRTSSARRTGTPTAAHSMRSWPRTVRAGWPGTSPRSTPTSRAGWGMRCSGRPLKWVIPRPCWSSSMSLSTVVLPAPGAPRSAVTRPACASKDTSSTAGGSSLRGLLVSPMAWITQRKIARYVRFSGHSNFVPGRPSHWASRVLCQTSGRSIGGLSSVAPPARKSWAGRPPCRVVVPPVGTRKPGVPVTLRWKLRGSSTTPHTAS